LGPGRGHALLRPAAAVAGGAAPLPPAAPPGDGGPLRVLDRAARHRRGRRRCGGAPPVAILGGRVGPPAVAPSAIRIEARRAQAIREETGLGADEDPRDLGGRGAARPPLTAGAGDRARDPVRLPGPRPVSPGPPGTRCTALR